MLRKILNGKAKSITSAAVIIGGASLASRLLGVIRDRVLASTFGAGDILDAYYAAFRIPDTVFNLIVLGALSAGFIPLFSDFLQIDKDRAWKFANNVLNILLFTLLGVCLVLILFTPWIMHFIVPGFEGEKFELTVQLTRIMFLSPLLLGVSSFFGGILQTMKRFVVYSMAPIMYNVGIIIGALLLAQWWGPAGLAFGVVLGALFHLLIQLPTAEYLGFRYRWIFKPFDRDFIELIRIMIPRTLSLAVNQLNFLAITIFATLLAAGSLSVFNFAMNLQSFPLGIFGISFAIAAFPTLCELAARDNYSKFIISFSNTVRQILFFIIPLSALFIILRAQIVRVILGGGLFDWPATIATANALAIFSISLFAQALIPLFIRGFFALKDSITPFVIAAISIGGNIILAYYLMQPFTLGSLSMDLGVHGLVVSYSIAMIVQLILLWIFLRIKVRSLNESAIFYSVGKIVLATIAMAIVTQFMKFGVEPFFGTETFVGIFLQGFISGTVGIAIFVIVGLAINMEELNTLIASLKRKLINKKEYIGEEEGIDVTVD